MWLGQLHYLVQKTQLPISIMVIKLNLWYQLTTTLVEDPVSSYPPRTKKLHTQDLKNVRKLTLIVNAFFNVVFLFLLAASMIIV